MKKNLMTSSFNKNPIGTGSYKLKEFKTGQDIELIANDDFLKVVLKLIGFYINFTRPKYIFLYLKQNKLDIGSLNSYASIKTVR